MTLTDAQLRALRFLAGREYGIPSEIGYAVVEDRSKRRGGMVPQGAGRLGGMTATRLVAMGLVNHSTRRQGFAAYEINHLGRQALRDIEG